NPVPVVMTGADVRQPGDPFHDGLASRKGAGWFRAYELDRLRGVKDGLEDPDPEDILAYQWWLLNPPEGRPVYAPKRCSHTGWHCQMLWVMRNVIYDELELFEFVKSSVDYFTADADNDVLASFAKVAP